MRAILIILCLAVVLASAWYLSHKGETSRPTVLPEPIPSQALNIPFQTPVSKISNTPDNSITASGRPASVDEETWRKYLSYRQTVLSENQPVEFYARVADESGQPVEGAKLEISLERLDETVFTTTNYLHWDPALAYQKKQLELISDAQGWFRLSGVTGKGLNLIGLAKDGYLSLYPTGNFAGVYYDFHGNRTPTGDALMTNSWNPGVGYMLYLRKN